MKKLSPYVTPVAWTAAGSDTLAAPICRPTRLPGAEAFRYQDSACRDSSLSRAAASTISFWFRRRRLVLPTAFSDLPAAAPVSFHRRPIPAASPPPACVCNPRSGWSGERIPCSQTFPGTKDWTCTTALPESETRLFGGHWDSGSRPKGVPGTIAPKTPGRGAEHNADQKTEVATARNLTDLFGPVKRGIQPGWKKWAISPRGQEARSGPI